MRLQVCLAREGDGGIKTPLEEENGTVLIVEDDPSVLRSLGRLVRSAGFTVRTFNSPGALLRSEIPNAGACLVTDVNLPEMNGVELCDVLSASGHGLPAILITGQTDPNTNRLIGQARAVAILHKPFAAALLLDAISAALSRSTPDAG
jgi:FixJ family two-component response regulator